MNILKLMKLLYLADRQSMAEYGSPISYDHVVAMPHGPVLSTVYNLTSGTVGGSVEARWDEWISSRENHDIKLKRDISREALDELSDSDLEILCSIWKKFGHMSQWELRDYTHKHCPEWVDPEGSSIPIKAKDILEAVGFGADEARELGKQIEAERHLDRVLAGI